MSTLKNNKLNDQILKGEEIGKSSDAKSICIYQQYGVFVIDSCIILLLKGYTCLYSTSKNGIKGKGYHEYIIAL